MPLPSAPSPTKKPLVLERFIEVERAGAGRRGDSAFTAVSARTGTMTGARASGAGTGTATGASTCVTTGAGAFAGAGVAPGIGAGAGCTGAERAGAGAF